LLSLAHKSEKELVGPCAAMLLQKQALDIEPREKGGIS
jgi:hypothetical protein